MSLRRERSRPASTILLAVEMGLLAAGMVLPTILAVFYFLLTRGWSVPAQRLAVLGSKLLQFSLPVAWWLLQSKSQIEPIEDGGHAELQPSLQAGNSVAAVRAVPVRGPVGLVEGILSGLLAAAVVAVGYVAVLAPSPAATEVGSAIARFLARNGLTTIWQYVLVSLTFSVVHAGLEEVYWRWFIFGGLTRFAPLGWAIVIAAVSFTAHHVVIVGEYFGWLTWQQVVAVAGVLVAGLYWCWLFRRTSSLFGPWISHVIADLAIFAVGFDLVYPHLAGRTN